MAESTALVGKITQISLPKLPPLLGIVGFLTFFWLTPAPEGLSVPAWHLLGIFLSTLIAIITNILPMGAIAILALSLCTLTHTLTLKQALSGFSSHIVWLIFVAFVLARGFIKTGLGARIAYYFVLNMGKNTLGLGYGLVATELLLAPFTPSNTARGAGILFPIISSLSQEYGSSPKDGTQRKVGAFLMKLGYQTNVITSALFLTAMAGNPLIASIATKMGLELSWTRWALAGLLPGLICLAVMPALLYYLYPPSVKQTPEAPDFARKKLTEMGPMKTAEWLMLGTFGLLLVLWVLGSHLNIDPTVAALLGLSILLLTGVLTWDDVLKENNAWHTFVWLTTLLTLSNFLTEFGMMDWFTGHMKTFIEPFHWVTALTVLSLLYFYSHYTFASMAAHIGALFSPFVLLAIAAGAPPMLTLLLFTFFSSLCSGITHYGTGTAPVYFGANYVTLREWWKLGGILSVVNIVIWATVGTVWWKLLGLY